MIWRAGISRVFASVVVVAALLLGSGFSSTVGSVPIAQMGLAAQQDESPVLPDCSPSDEDNQEQPTAAAAPSFAPPEAFGAAVDLLASAFVAEVPAGALRLVLRRIALETGQGADAYDTQGPLLYHVRSGTVTFLVGGTQEVARSAGTCLFVPVGTEVGYVNDAEPATGAELLRLSLAPPDTEDREITSFVETAGGAAATPPVSELMIRADVAAAPSESAWLFLAAVTWDSPVVEAAWHRHPGPVGLHVETGGLTLELGSGRRELPERGCAYLAADVIYRGLAAQAPTTVLLGGVLPAGGQLWTAAEPPGPEGEGTAPLPSEVRCSE